MTNIDEVFALLAQQGQSPRIYSDSYSMLELMGHRLDREVERLFMEAKEQGLESTDITKYIDSHVDMSNVLKTTLPHFDGGYVMCGMTGSGEMFSMRDPSGIRPAFYYADDEIVAIASERPVLQTTFDLNLEDVKELQRGQALIINRAGEMRLEQILPAAENKACSFERIYFSRGNDYDIHKERKQLGYQLRDQILKAVDGDLEHSVFSYIPNTAEVAYYGMLDGMRSISPVIRTEKVVWKDIKLRTFITEGSTRNDLAAHVYDITFGSVEPNVDNLVVIDDSIVRGTTLRESIIKILDHLHPKKIVIVSSAPQIRYPDYYGIDMSRIGEFIAFQACVSLLHERKMTNILDDAYAKCKAGDLEAIRSIYEPFTAEELNAKMVELLRPEGVTTPIELVFQTIEGLHSAIPNHPGDWYFTGHYPTQGGARLATKSFVDWYEKNSKK
jgi:amidophosphoribosyltransferase